MSNYTHLQTEIATSRYTLAASWLAGIDHIIEIGGAISPISDFVSYESYSSCNVIDPTIVPIKMYDHLMHHQTTFQEFDFSTMLSSIFDKSTIGLVMIGIELDYNYNNGSKKEELEEIAEIINRSSVVILEHVVTNATAVHQVNLLEVWALGEGLKKAVELTMKFEYDVNYRMNITPSFHKTRRFVVYLDDHMMESRFDK